MSIVISEVSFDVFLTHKLAHKKSSLPESSLCECGDCVLALSQIKQTTNHIREKLPEFHDVFARLVHNPQSIVMVGKNEIDIGTPRMTNEEISGNCQIISKVPCDRCFGQLDCVNCATFSVSTNLMNVPYIIAYVRFIKILGNVNHFTVGKAKECCERYIHILLEFVNQNQNVGPTNKTRKRKR